MKHKCNDCGHIGYNFISDGSKEGDLLCPKCKSRNVKEVVDRKNSYIAFSNPEGDMEPIEDYYSSIGSGMS